MKIRITGTKAEVEIAGSKLEAAALESEEFTIEKWTGTLVASITEKTYARYYQIKLKDKN